MGFVNKRSSFRRSLTDFNSQMPLVFLVTITMAAIAVFIQLDRMKTKSHDPRAKAFQQGATGIRVEAEEMTLNGVTGDPGGTFILFGQ